MKTEEDAVFLWFFRALLCGMFAIWSGYKFVDTGSGWQFMQALLWPWVAVIWTALTVARRQLRDENLEEE